MIRKLLDLIGRFFRWIGGLMLDCVSNNPQISIDVDTQNLNLADLIAAQDMPCGNVEIVIQEGVKVGSDDTANPAIETGDLTGYTVRVINRGEIYGKGGDGGGGGYYSYLCGFPGGDGGTAVKATSKIAIVNENTVSGGGGGGGGGALWGMAIGGNGGGGGAGRNVGVGGVGPDWGNYPTYDGEDGTLELGGAGAVSDPARDGGDGGDRGEAGEAGTNGDTTQDQYGGAGGLAGYYIDGIANVQFQNNGTVAGRVT